MAAWAGAWEGTGPTVRGTAEAGAADMGEFFSCRDAKKASENWEQKLLVTRVIFLVIIRIKLE